MLATILLSILPQEPVSPTILPEVGTKVAIHAQNDFRAWLGAAAKSSTVPLQVKYDVQASIGLFDPAGDVEATFSGVMNSYVQAEGKVRHQLRGLSVLDGDRDIPVAITLVLNGESFWLAIHADGLRVIPEDGIYLTGKIAALQDLYAFTSSFHAWSVEQESAQGIDPSFGLGPQFAGFVRSLPEQGVELLHPTSAMFYGMAPFTCQKFEKKQGAVLASMTLDTQPEALMVEMAAQWDDLWSGLFGNPEEETRSSNAIQILREHLTFTLSFDESTAIPLALNIDYDVNAEILGLGTAEERMTFSAEVSGQTLPSMPLEAALFTAPLPDQVPTDVTGLLEIALTEMRNEKAEAESKMDSRF